MAKQKQPREKLTPVPSRKRRTPEGRNNGATIAQQSAPAEPVTSLAPGEYIASYPLDRLVFLASNCVDHPEEQVADLQALLTERGQLEWLVANKRTDPPTVISGNGRLSALLAAGKTHGAVYLIDVDDATAQQIAAEMNYSSEARVWSKAQVDAMIFETRGKVICGERLQAMMARVQEKYGTPEVVDVHDRVTPVEAKVKCPRCGHEF